MAKIYTAQDMRDKANKLEAKYGWYDMVEMLRQAADALEREEKLKKLLLEMVELADDLKCADVNNFFDTVEVDKLINKARKLAK